MSEEVVFLNKSSWDLAPSWGQLYDTRACMDMFNKRILLQCHHGKKKKKKFGHIFHHEILKRGFLGWIRLLKNLFLTNNTLI